MKRLSKLFCILFFLILPVVIDRPAHGEQKEKKEQVEKSPQESFEEMRQRIANEFDSMRTKTTDDFETMQKKIDEDFARMLSQAWKDMELLEGIVPDTVPEPVETPVARPAKTPPPPKPTPKDTVTIPKIEPEVKVPIPPPAPPGIRENTVEISYFGSEIPVRYDRRFVSILDGPPEPKAISASWLRLSGCDYQPLLQSLLKAKDELSLNDWGYFLLVGNCAEAIYRGLPNEGTLFTWFMLIKSGFDARIGWSGNNLYLLLPMVSRWYGAPYYVFGDRHYYIVPPRDGRTSAKSVYTYEGNYQSSVRQVDLSFIIPPKFPQDVIRERYVFEYDKTYSLSATVNKDLIEFYKYYPQTDIDLYFKAPMNPDTRTELLAGLKKILQGRNEAESANLLLRFVQTAFEYKRDDQQFGFEKSFYPDETLFYPYSDCEDRAVLFSYLVRSLLGLDVVILDYPGHIATAVCFSRPVEGDYVDYGGRRYVICDPTYIRANCGESMPEYRGRKAKVIPAGGSSGSE